MRRHWKLLVAVIIAAVFIIAAGGYVWLTDLVDPMPEARPALDSDDRVIVETDPWLAFEPAAPSATGLVLYPGARVPAEAYAPPARAIAEAGYTTIIPSMPFGLAVLDADVADEVMAAYPQVERWVIGGHSLGGAMAAQHAADRGDLDGLTLWAAYPPGGVDLSGDDLLASSISATADGLTSLEEIEASRAQLPPDTVFVEIAGGNHAGFGWYGEQDGDGVATISREEQQAQVVTATLDLLEAVSSR